ncbi:hypothetical protein L198_05655 [Cryptococcus wingfieldii CBS 7118]|uniref:Uncharacterized protein n=1 Tax=Cryptococcus wingfieldii CBS 7118 TaxID=1295528 RepID=A0A1E3ITM4_9TREE|nr:hypothetical protein L198_05655 [Cryptococcus wingfieldii CBS 7118]ODN91983.1 hypothetical protein L198_05655 [Cryptococcus wingfieldii CBS 7118]
MQLGYQLFINSSSVSRSSASPPRVSPPASPVPPVSHIFTGDDCLPHASPEPVSLALPTSPSSSVSPSASSSSPIALPAFPSSLVALYGSS